VKSKDRATFERLGELMASENNAERYRKRLAADRPPAIPFLGAFLPPHMAAATLGLTPSFSLSLCGLGMLLPRPRASECRSAFE
jgi:hypothetical protein